MAEAPGGTTGGGLRSRLLHMLPMRMRADRQRESDHDASDTEENKEELSSHSPVDDADGSPLTEKSVKSNNTSPARSDFSLDSTSVKLDLLLTDLTYKHNENHDPNMPRRKAKKKIPSSPSTGSRATTAPRDDDDDDGKMPAKTTTTTTEGADKEPTVLEEEEKDQQPTAAATAAPQHVHITEEGVRAMTVQQLKTQLELRAVPFKKNWKRDKCVQLLIHALHLQQPVVTTESDLAKGKKKCPPVDNLAGFAPGAFWETLKEDVEVVIDPELDEGLYSPTDSHLERGEKNIQQQPKHNFSEKFDRPPFVGTINRPLTDRFGEPPLDADGEPRCRLSVRTKGHARPSFLKKHHLTAQSIPTEFVEPYFPMHEVKLPNNKKGFSMAQLAEWANYQAIRMSNNGEHYSNWHHNRDYFTAKDIRQMAGLYLLQGINHSPSIECKFNPNDNLFVQQNIKLSRFHHFKSFFVCQDPTLVVPNKKTHPNWKVQPLIDWVNYIGIASWLCGPSISADEQTIAFKGRCSMKMRIKFKKAGDGFMCDAVCDSGFTFQVYFRNEPPPQKYVDLGLSPLHARVLALCDALEDTYHRLWMDNLYLSALFAKACYQHDKKILIAGVTRPALRGLPVTVVTKEPKEPKKRIQEKNRVKAAVLRGDNECPDLVAIMFYDSKPVHFLSTVAESIEWITKDKKVWSNGDNTKVKCLRLNITDQHNNNMNSVDLADQCRNHYRIDFWIRFYKWWWSIWIWGLGVLVVNAYMVHRDVMEEAGVPKKDWLTHYEFQQAVALAWIDLDEEDLRARRRRLARQSTVGRVEISRSQ